MTILSGLLLSGCMNDSTSHSHKTIAKVTASAVSTSSAKQTAENPKLSTKQQTAYNDTMSHALIQDQQDARQGKSRINGRCTLRQYHTISTMDILLRSTIIFKV